VNDLDTLVDLRVRISGLEEDFAELNERVSRLEKGIRIQPDTELGVEIDKFVEAREKPVERLMHYIKENEASPRAAAQRVISEQRHAQHGPWELTASEAAKNLLEKAGYPRSLGGRSVNALPGLVAERAEYFAQDLREFWGIVGGGLVGFRRQELETLGLDWRDVRILGGEDPEEEA